jgi:Sulfotransferase family
LGGVSGSGSRVTVVFILSTPYAGSTWLNLVLGSHDWALNLGEYHRPFIKPGHVACKLCDAEARAECTLLHGIEQVRAEDAFHFAAQRSGRSVLIDASKSIDWCLRFLGRDDIDAKIIHLFRHPCGFAESFVRRGLARSYAEAFDVWESWNQSVEAFLKQAKAPYVEACYEDLAEHPDRAFPALCAFIGRAWDKAALEYWKTEHHGLGGNGAASVYLRGRKRINYMTLDDDFYSQLTTRPSGADKRWRDRLLADVCDAAMRRAYVGQVRSRFPEGAWSDRASGTVSTRAPQDRHASAPQPRS